MNTNNNEPQNEKLKECLRATDSQGKNPSQKVTSVSTKEAPSREDWEGGASRPEDEAQKSIRHDRRDRVRETPQSLPTQNTHEIDADQEVDKNAKE